LERLERDLRAMGLSDLLGNDWKLPGLTERKGVRVADPSLAGNVVVIEDLVYSADEVGKLTPVSLGNILSRLLPAHEAATRQRVVDSLVLIPDSDFADVVQRAVPVQARIRLNENKTTGTSEKGNKGNLWYEEVLPSDCLFGVLVTERSSRANGQNNKTPVEIFTEHLGKQPSVQIGGNETVGQGICWWTSTDISSGVASKGQSHG
jgi:CRISPR-associated protein Cmr4